MMLASFYSARQQGWVRLKDYQRAVEDGRLSLALLAQTGDEGKKDLSAVWCKQALTYYYLGKTVEMMMAADSCVKTALEFYGPLHSTTMDAYSLRSNLAGFCHKKDIALHDCQEIFSIIRQNVERNFVYLTASERSAYWNKYMPETTQMFAFAHMMEERQSTFTDVLFSQQLLTKGLLLTAESTLQRAIDGDDNLKAAYQKIRQLRVKATDDKTLPKDATEAALEADRIERTLGTSASTLYQFLDFLKVGVKNVRERLKPTDIAVEFVDCHVGKDSTMYAALVMSPRWQHARFLPLIEAREIPRLSDNLTDRIWKPILDAAGRGVKDIYFSPSGLLYQLPIVSSKDRIVRAEGKKFYALVEYYKDQQFRKFLFQGPDPQTFITAAASAADVLAVNKKYGINIGLKQDLFEQSYPGASAETNTNLPAGSTLYHLSYTDVNTPKPQDHWFLFEQGALSQSFYTLPEKDNYLNSLYCKHYTLIVLNFLHLKHHTFFHQ